MKPSALGIFALLASFAAVAGCSGSSGTPSNPVFVATPAATATAAPTGTTAPTATAVPTAAAAPTASPSSLATLTPNTTPPPLNGNGEFRISPLGRYYTSATGAGGVADQARVFVSERFYAGTYTIPSCVGSDTQTTCTPSNGQLNCAKNGASLLVDGTADINTGFFFIDVSNPNGVALTCTLTIADTTGHTTPYVITTDPNVALPAPTATPAPAATGDGVIRFSPSAPIVLAQGHNVTVLPSEAGYSGEFLITGCSATCGTNLIENSPEGGLICLGPGPGGFELNWQSPLTDSFMISTGQPPSVGFTCTYTVSDEFGHTAPLAVTTSP